VTGVSQAVWQVIGALAGGTTGLAVLQAIFSRRQNAAETEGVSVKTALSLVAVMRQDLTDMRGRITELESRLLQAESTIDSYRDRVEYLGDVLKDSDIKVEPWIPPGSGRTRRTSGDLDKASP
jgi:hypothetical protein